MSGFQGGSRPSVVLTRYFRDRAELERPPALPAGRGREARRRVIGGAATWVAVILGLLVWRSSVEGFTREWVSTLIPIAFAVGFVVFLLQFASHRMTLRRQETYARLVRAHERADARIIELRMPPQDQDASISGEIRYWDATGMPRALSLGTPTGLFTWRLALRDLPSEESAVVVWHTPDHRIAEIRVHADGSGAPIEEW